MDASGRGRLMHKVGYQFVFMLNNLTNEFLQLCIYSYLSSCVFNTLNFILSSSFY